MSRGKNPRLKKAHTETEYTNEQIMELAKCADDPVYFTMNYVYIKHPIKGQILFGMYDYQQELMHMYEDNRFSIVLSARQTGKTETTCAYLLWYALFNKGKTVLIVSNKSTNAMEMIGKIQNAYEELPHWLKPGIDDASWNKHECKFDNKSRIISQATSSDSGRGLSISLLYCDELAFVKPHIQTEFWDSIFPTLSCLEGNTLVLTDKGYRRISSMFNDDDKIGELYDYDEDTELFTHVGMSKPSKKYVSPQSKTVKITTSHGREIETTPHHPLMKLTSDGGELHRSDSLSVGDYVRVDYNMNVFGDRNVGLDLAYMLGGYIAEGWINQKSTIWISNADDEFRNIYLRNGFVQDKGTYHKIRLCSRPEIKKWESMGIDSSLKCFNKIIPDSVFEFDEESLYEFLGGLFDGDGSVTNRGVNYTSTSHQLVKELQIILNNIGISSRIYKRDSEKLLEKHKGRIMPSGQPLNNLRDAWGLNVPLSQMQKCKDKIRFKIKRKIDKLNALIKLREQDDFKQFSIPATLIKPLFERTIEESNHTREWFRKMGLRFDKVLNNKPTSKVTQKFLGRLINVINEQELPVSSYVSNVLNELHDENVCWEMVKLVEESYAEKTYDFTVPQAGTFLQNGIMGSNTGGGCIISSTPNGSVNLFAQMWRKWENGIGEFQGMYVPWDAPPGRDEKFKKDNIAALGLEKWKQEYECKFLSSDGTLIDTEILEEHEKRLLHVHPEFKIDDQDFWEQIHPEKTYVISCDPATGSKKDFSVIQAFEFPSMKQVLEYRNNTYNSVFIYSYLKKVVNFFHKNGGEVYWSFENNAVGQAIAALYETDETPPDASLISEPKKNKLGFFTTHQSKVKACLKFKEMFEDGKITINSKAFITELQSFVRKSNSYEAQTGATDDCVSAFLVAIRILEEMATYDSAAYYKLYGFEDEEDWQPDESNIDQNPLPFTF